MRLVCLVVCARTGGDDSAATTSLEDAPMPETPDLAETLKKLYDLLKPLNMTERRRVVEGTFTLLGQDLPGTPNPDPPKKDEKKD